MKSVKNGIRYGFLCIICIPSVVTLLSAIIGIHLDETLNGYTAVREKVELSVKNVVIGRYQDYLSYLLENNIQPRAIMIKAYNSILYYGLKDCNADVIAGSDDYLFERLYIMSELSLGEDYKHNEENVKILTDFANQLGKLNDLLRKNDKYMLLVIAPSKAQFYQDKIPDRFFNISSYDGSNQTELFLDLIERTNVNYIYFGKEEVDLAYPAFYRSGTHWSRTFEQVASMEIVNKIENMNGKNYDYPIPIGVSSRNKPYGRDADLLDLLNIWGGHHEEYYEYVMGKDPFKNDIDENELTVAMYGDSFSQGIKREFQSNLSSISLCRFNNNEYIENDEGEVIPVYGDWDNVSLSNYVGNKDVVIIEMIEPAIRKQTLGFVDAMISYLEEQG